MTPFVLVLRVQSYEEYLDCANFFSLYFLKFCIKIIPKQDKPQIFNHINPQKKEQQLLLPLAILQALSDNIEQFCK